MKDLKQEYEQMILPEIPDLWDRIEASLPVEEEISSSAALPDPATASTPIKSTRKSNIYKWASVAAACLCAFIAIPIALKDMHGCGGSYSESAAMDMAMDAADNASLDATGNASLNVAPEAAMDTTDNAFTDAEAAEVPMEEVFADEGDAKKYPEDIKPSREVSATYEILARIAEPITENKILIGYQITVLENTDHFYQNETLEVYFSEDFNTNDSEIPENTQQQYRLNLIYNEEKERYEIVSIE